MLMRDAIEQAKRDGLLVPARPIAPWAGEPRAFLMCQPLHNAIEDGAASPDQKERQRWARLEAAIGHFVEGGLVTSSLLKQLAPAKYEHWELISRRPRPSVRVFGRFALPDVFVGTHLQLRNKLGDMWSAQFEHEKLVCEDHWRDAGLPEPFTDAPDFRYEKYITANARRKLRV
jgi:hypothetical protein